MNLNYINQGTGIPLVFQHGLGANVLQIQKLFGDLSNIQLVSVDCPGHGHSPYPVFYKPSFDYYAEQVLKVVDHLGIKKFILGGLSMGAGISLNLALRYPESIKALVLLRPAWLNETCPDNLKILLDAAQHIKTENGQLSFSQNKPFQKIQMTLPAAANSILGVFNSNQQPALSEVLKLMVNDRPFDNLESLGNIDLPTQIIANDNDPLHPFHMAEVIHEYLPNSTLNKVVSRYMDDEQHRTEVKSLVEEFVLSRSL